MKKTDRYRTGILSSTGEVRNGKRSGEWFFFSKQGQVMERGAYRDGKKHGTWYKFDWDRSGLVTPLIYERGVLVRRESGERIRAKKHLAHVPSAIPEAIEATNYIYERILAHTI